MFASDICTYISIYVLFSQINQMQLCYFHRYEQVSGARVKVNKHKLTSPHIDQVFTWLDTHLHNLTSPLAFASVTVAMIVAVPVIFEKLILKVT